MGEPTGIIGQIRIEENAIKSYLKTSQAKQLINSISQVILDQSDDCYIFSYDKSSMLLSFFFYYRDAYQNPLVGEDFNALLALRDFFNENTTGYLIGYRDILNISNDGIIAAYQITKKHWELTNKLDDAVIFKVYEQHNKHLSLLSKRKFCLAYSKAHLMPYILTSIKKILQASRQNDFIQHIPNAALNNTLHIFGDYYYNGICVYSLLDKPHRLTGIDPTTFVKTAYGAADAHHVVIENCVYKTDPKAFKKISGIYYKTANDVLYYSYQDNALIKVEGACVKSFKDFFNHSEDNQAIYYRHKRIEKSRISNFQILPTSGYTAHLFISPELAYFEDTLIDLSLIDAKSFKFINLLSTADNLSIVRAIDSKGPLLLRLANNKQTVEVLRDLLVINQLIQPKESTDEFEDMSHFNMPNFVTYYQKHYGELDFFEQVQQFFNYCDKSYQETNQLCYLQRIIHCYEILKPCAYGASFLYSYVIKAYALLNEDYNTLMSIEAAIIAAAPNITEILTMPYLKPVYETKTYKKFKQFEHTRLRKKRLPIVSFELMEWLQTLTSPQLEACKGNILAFHYFPTMSEIAAYQKSQQLSRVQLNEKNNNWDEYIDLVQQTIQLLFNQPSIYTLRYYSDLAEHEAMPITMHLFELARQFSIFHIVGKVSDNLDLTSFYDAIKLLKLKIKSLSLVQQKDALKTLESHQLYHILIDSSLER